MQRHESPREVGKGSHIGNTAECGIPNGAHY